MDTGWLEAALGARVDSPGEETSGNLDVDLIGVEGQPTPGPLAS